MNVDWFAVGMRVVVKLSDAPECEGTIAENEIIDDRPTGRFLVRVKGLPYLVPVRKSQMRNVDPS